MIETDRKKLYTVKAFFLSTVINRDSSEEGECIILNASTVSSGRKAKSDEGAGTRVGAKKRGRRMKKKKKG